VNEMIVAYFNVLTRTLHDWLKPLAGNLLVILTKTDGTTRNSSRVGVNLVL